jgi:hypothetical protein
MSLTKVVSLVVTLRAAGICRVRTGCAGPLSSTVAVCGPGLPLERLVHVGLLALTDRAKQISKISQSPHFLSLLVAMAMTEASGGASGGAGHAANGEKARRPLLSPRVSHSLSLYRLLTRETASTTRRAISGGSWGWWRCRRLGGGTATRDTRGRNARVDNSLAATGRGVLVAASHTRGLP